MTRWQIAFTAFIFAVGLCGGYVIAMADCAVFESRAMFGRPTCPRDSSWPPLCWLARLTSE